MNPASGDVGWTQDYHFFGSPRSIFLPNRVAGTVSYRMCRYAFRCGIHRAPAYVHLVDALRNLGPPSQSEAHGHSPYDLIV